MTLARSVKNKTASSLFGDAEYSDYFSIFIFIFFNSDAYTN